MHSQYLITLLVILFLSKFYNHESPVLDYCSVGSKPHNGNYIYSQMTKSQVKTDSVLEPWQGAEHVKSSSCWTKNRRNKMCACVCVCNWQNKQKTTKKQIGLPQGFITYIINTHTLIVVHKRDWTKLWVLSRGSGASVSVIMVARDRFLNDDYKDL